MGKVNTYKPRYFVANVVRTKINIYKDGYLRRFYERRGRRVKRGALYRHYVLVAKNRKWTIARRFISPIRRSTRRRVRSAGRTAFGRPSKRRYITAFRFKQRLRHFYGLGSHGKESNFVSLFKATKNLYGISNESFFSRLESRLDRTLFRRRLFPTLYGCRQFIQHHGILLNGVFERSAQFELQVGDTVSVPEQVWSVLYHTLLHRVYYRRWGLYIKITRFYSKYKKKLFRARKGIISRTRPSFRKYGFGRSSSIFSSLTKFSSKASRPSRFNYLNKKPGSGRETFLVNKGSIAKKTSGVFNKNKPIKNKSYYRPQKYSSKRSKSYKGKFSFSPRRQSINLRNGLRKRSWYLSTNTQMAPKAHLFDFYAKRPRRVASFSAFSTNSILWSQNQYFWHVFKYSKRWRGFSRSTVRLLKSYRQITRLRLFKKYIGSKLPQREKNTFSAAPISSNQIGNIIDQKQIKKRRFNYAGYSKHRRSYFLLSAFSAYAQQANFSNINFGLNSSEVRQSEPTKLTLFKELSSLLKERKSTPEYQTNFRDSTGINQKRINLLLSPSTINSNVSIKKDEVSIKALRDAFHAIPWKEKKIASRKQRKLFKFFYVQKLRKVFLPSYSLKNKRKLQHNKRNKRNKKGKLVKGINVNNVTFAYSPKAIAESTKVDAIKSDKKVNVNTNKVNELNSIELLKARKQRSAKSIAKRRKHKRFKFRNRRQLFKRSKKDRRYKKRRRRKLARFIRRWRRRARRIRSFPRRKVVHRYFPSYLQRDLRTLRVTKINSASTGEIYAPFRVFPGKMFAFYKSRGY